MQSTKAGPMLRAWFSARAMGLLAELNRGVPFFTGRYEGHMSFDQTLASQVGYFAAMRYDPNNVAIEASPKGRSCCDRL